MSYLQSKGILTSFFIFIPVATSQSNRLKHWTSLDKIQVSMQKKNLSYLP